jgi:uncharacterized BrkB/YihY/UPF0761 family membrane protein
MVSLGLFNLLADPNAIQTLVDKLGDVAPAQATELIESSLTRMSENSVRASLSSASVWRSRCGR